MQPINDSLTDVSLPPPHWNKDIFKKIIKSEKQRKKNEKWRQSKGFIGHYEAEQHSRYGSPRRREAEWGRVHVNIK